MQHHAKKLRIGPSDTDEPEREPHDISRLNIAECSDAGEQDLKKWSGLTLGETCRDQEGASAAEKLPSVQPLSQACTDLVIKQDVDQDETPGQAAASVPSGPGQTANHGQVAAESGVEVFIGGLPADADEDSVAAALAAACGIAPLSVRLQVARVSGACKGYAYASVRSMEEAMAAVHGVTHACGACVAVHIARRPVTELPVAPASLRTDLVGSAESEADDKPAALVQLLQLLKTHPDPSAAVAAALAAVLGTRKAGIRAAGPSNINGARHACTKRQKHTVESISQAAVQKDVDPDRHASTQDYQTPPITSQKGAGRQTDVVGASQAPEHTQTVHCQSMQATPCTYDHQAQPVQGLPPPPPFNTLSVRHGFKISTSNLTAIGPGRPFHLPSAPARSHSPLHPAQSSRAAPVYATAQAPHPAAAAPSAVMQPSTAPPVVDMGISTAYLYPRCASVLAMVRAQPGAATKTPLSLVNEYSAKLMLEVACVDEVADSPTGPYHITCRLQSKGGHRVHSQGRGQGRNKREARQASAAACVESLLTDHGVDPSEFLTQPKQPSSYMQRQQAMKPGLGFTAGSSGGRRRREDDERDGGGWQAAGARSRGSPWGNERDERGARGSRGVAFTRAVLPISVPESYSRNSPEIIPPPPRGADTDSKSKTGEGQGAAPVSLRAYLPEWDNVFSGGTNGQAPLSLAPGGPSSSTRGLGANVGEAAQGGRQTPSAWSDMHASSSTKRDFTTFATQPNTHGSSIPVQPPAQQWTWTPGVHQAANGATQHQVHQAHYQSQALSASPYPQNYQMAAHGPQHQTIGSHSWSPWGFH